MHYLFYIQRSFKPHKHSKYSEKAGKKQIFAKTHRDSYREETKS